MNMDDQCNSVSFKKDVNLVLVHLIYLKMNDGGLGGVAVSIMDCSPETWV